ncbi:MAG: aminotransferase class I/II-fold pyridoxal phosphate-dependent enzyme [Alphaproteobacteria bacterium]|nr:aminotransferase class I/II-fold pyridoxal phosphate-dependent enzyme [Alphaproteobacteria bacterium]
MTDLPPGPFARLATLLGDEKPGKPPINLSIGDPSGTVPDFIAEALRKEAARFGNYPAIIGTEDWREAAAGWLNRRFELGEAIRPDSHVLPLNGTREGLFSTLFPLLPRTKAGTKPMVGMPNPFYQVYAAAALGTGAEPLYVPATARSGFLPDYAGLPEDALRRLAAVYICSPSNPEGATADECYWEKLFDLADRHDFIVLADECYADIYFGAPPVSALTARFKQHGDFRRLLTFHSLSKRSGLPGLRSGMVAGDPDLIARARAFRNVAGPQMPGPIQAASAAAWRDEAHVAANRAAYAQKMALAERVLGNRVRAPAGGFFLWLPTPNGEETALGLWREEGVKVLPGAYMGREIEAGKTQSNPGFSYVRIALVSDLSTIMTALERVNNFLGNHDAQGQSN